MTRIQQKIQERNFEKAIKASEAAAKEESLESSKEAMRQAEIDSDLANAMDLFDIVDKNSASANRSKQADQRQLKTKADYAAFQADILKKVKNCQTTAEYNNFVQDLIPLLLTGLNATNLKAVQKSVNKLVVNKEQQEKTQSKRGAAAPAAKPVSTAAPSKKGGKPTVNVNSKKTVADKSAYEDYIEDEYDDYADDFDDFM